MNYFVVLDLMEKELIALCDEKAQLEKRLTAIEDCESDFEFLDMKISCVDKNSAEFGKRYIIIDDRFDKTGCRTIKIQSVRNSLDVMTVRVDTSLLENYSFGDANELAASEVAKTQSFCEIIEIKDRLHEIDAKIIKLNEKIVGVNKHIEADKQNIEKFKQNTKECIEYLKKRGVTELIHFTPVQNLQSIFEHGLVPADMQKIMGVEAVRTDAQRLEGKCYNNLSISFPNYRLLNIKQKVTGYRFAVLKIDLEVLSENDLTGKVWYSNHNAASKAAEKGRTLDALKKLFEEGSVTAKESNTRKYGLADKYTIDEQAEVLVKDIIPPKYIKEVCVKPGCRDIYEFAKGTDFADRVKYDGTMFGERNKKGGDYYGYSSGVYCSCRYIPELYDERYDF